MLAKKTCYFAACNLARKDRAEASAISSASPAEKTATNQFRLFGELIYRVETNRDQNRIAIVLLLSAGRILKSLSTLAITTFST